MSRPSRIQSQYLSAVAPPVAKETCRAKSMLWKARLAVAGGAARRKAIKERGGGKPSLANQKTT